MKKFWQDGWVGEWGVEVLSALLQVPRAGQLSELSLNRKQKQEIGEKRKGNNNKNNNNLNEKRALRKLRLDQM